MKLRQLLGLDRRNILYGHIGAGLDADRLIYAETLLTRLCNYITWWATSDTVGQDAPYKAIKKVLADAKSTGMIVKVWEQKALKICDKTYQCMKNECALKNPYRPRDSNVVYNTRQAYYKCDIDCVDKPHMMSSGQVNKVHLTVCMRFDEHEQGTELETTEDEPLHTYEKMLFAAETKRLEIVKAKRERDISGVE